jgi:hypothetical protein
MIISMAEPKKEAYSGASNLSFVNALLFMLKTASIP